MNGNYAVPIYRLFHSTLCMKNRISTEPLLQIYYYLKRLVAKESVRVILSSTFSRDPAHESQSEEYKSNTKEHDNNTRDPADSNR
jgi:hypothetical protein